MIFKELTLYVDDVDKQKHFFSAWGLNIPEHENDVLSIPFGKTLIHFKEKPGAERYHYAFLIPNGMSKAALNWIMAREIEPWRHDKGELVKYWPFWDAHSVYFYDGVGNSVEFIEHAALDNAVEGTGFLPSEHIIQVAEMGIATPYVTDNYRLLREQTGLGFVRGNDSTFCDFGEWGSMFIIIDRSRKPLWYASDVPTQPAPFEATLTHQGKYVSFRYHKDMLEVKVREQ